MYSLFNKKPVASRGTRQPAYYRVVRKRLRSNLIKVIKHCRGSRYAVASDHLLVKLLQGLRLDTSLPLFEYHRLVTNRAEAIGKANGLTSSLWSSPSVKDGDFYGKGNEEIHLYVEEDIDLLQQERDWKSLEPVRILRHGKTSLSLTALDGRQHKKETDIAIIQIDIIKLAMQYYYWAKEMEMGGEDFRRTYMQFVFQYPLTNALISHHDVAVMNRLFNHFHGLALAEFDNEWPILIRDYSSDVDRYLLDRLDLFHNRQMVFNNMLEQVQLIRHDTLQPVVELPETPITRQNTWVFVIMRIPLITFLVQLDFKTGNARNTAYYSKIRREIREVKFDKGLKSRTQDKSGNRWIGMIENDIENYLL